MTLKEPHEKQLPFVRDGIKRKVARCGRRAGKTTGAATIAVRRFAEGGRVLYAVPTQEQVERFWFECKWSLREPLEAGHLKKNESKHTIELVGTEQRIKAKTAWNEDTLRGDHADLLILDEYQLMDPKAWSEVGAPMLLDNNGDAIFIYTTKRGKKGEHAKLMFKRAINDTTGRYKAYRWSSLDNPHLSREGLEEISQDMTRLAYRAEILAEEIDDDPRALWNRDIITHVTEMPDMENVYVGVDPPGTEEGAECGIVVAGMAKGRWYVMADHSVRGSPARWAAAAASAFSLFKADRIIAEVNNGGDMVEHTLRSVGAHLPIKQVRASRGKHTRAEPISALYEKGLVDHIGELSELEDQLCSWVPGDASPDRLDALVWAMAELTKRRGVYLA